MRSLWYDRETRPITMETYRRLRDTPSYCHVALTHLQDIDVVTDWLGLDHNLDDGPPWIFRTTISGSSYCRYASRMADALVTHDGAVQSINRNDQLLNIPRWKVRTE